MSMNIETVVGFFAGVFTTGSVLPQLYKTLKTRQTKDISLMMYVFLTLGLFLWFIYGILINEMPVIVANGVSLVFTATVLIMKARYG